MLAGKKDEFPISPSRCALFWRSEHVFVGKLIEGDEFWWEKLLRTIFCRISEKKQLRSCGEFWLTESFDDILSIIFLWNDFSKDIDNFDDSRKVSDEQWKINWLFTVNKGLYYPEMWRLQQTIVRITMKQPGWLMESKSSLWDASQRHLRRCNHVVLRHSGLTEQVQFCEWNIFPKRNQKYHYTWTFKSGCQAKTLRDGELTPVKRNHLAPRLEGAGIYHLNWPLKGRYTINEMTAKEVLWQNTHHLSMCQAKNRKKQTLSCTEGYRVTGLPNQFQYEGLVHPITLDLCAARKTIPFFKPPIATVGSSYFFRPKIKSLGFGFNYRVPGLVGWVLKGRKNGGMLGGLDMNLFVFFGIFGVGQ